MTQYILGIDIGTSSTKGILITTNGTVIKQAKQSYSLETPHPSWAQADANDWLKAVLSVISELTTGIKRDTIIAMGIDGLYGGAGIPVDAAGNVLGPTLIWMDRRATKETTLAQTLVSDKELMAITANLVDPYYGFTKLMWLRDNQPDLYQKAVQFLPPESYIIRQLTGETSINYAAAGNLAGVYDINTHQWSPVLAAKLGLELSKLPQTFIDSTTPAGYLSAQWVEQLNLPNNLPIFNTGVDVGPETVGTGVLAPGKVTIAIGTSMNAAVVTTTPKRDNGLIIWPYVYQPQQYYYNFVGANTAGAIIAWFTAEFANDLTNGPQELDKVSATVPAGSNGLTVLPYFMGERSPLWDSDVRGTILGLSLKTTRAELYNAFQEAIAFSVRQSIEQFGAQVGDTITLVGGVSSSAKMVQMIADVTGKTVLTTKSGGEANLGSAILAGIGMGVIAPETVDAWVKIDAEIKPDKMQHMAYNQYFTRYQKAYTHVKAFYCTQHDEYKI
ncbi:xylulokinase [Periweissella fabalis]|uniref:Uncharacterized protein n=1 Tax=Periweissella fabalis TaxID=1070421 RepID=A0A7X6N0C7_9LACO|nr:FGGY family carbohydrate kinase [Periweissella fabalis]MCM0599179.1 hypothetical protein [Periweissella fabalis]NKZ23458.1 hypothetical protein [Periweissella fabalis]